MTSRCIMLDQQHCDMNSEYKYLSRHPLTGGSVPIKLSSLSMSNVCPLSIMYVDYVRYPATPMQDANQSAIINHARHISHAQYQAPQPIKKITKKHPVSDSPRRTSSKNPQIPAHRGYASLPPHEPATTSPAAGAPAAAAQSAPWPGAAYAPRKQTLTAATAQGTRPGANTAGAVSRAWQSMCSRSY